MAINVETLIKPPPFKAPEPEIRVEPQAAVKAILTGRIEAVAKAVRRPFRFTHSRGYDLFALTAEEAYLPWDDRDRRGGNTKDKGLLQEAAMEVMQGYGLDPDISTVTSTMLHENGETSERRVYPSQTVRGLEFARWHRFTSEGTTTVDWRVQDNAPTINLSPSRANQVRSSQA